MWTDVEDGPEGIGQTGCGNGKSVAELLRVDRAVHVGAEIFVRRDDDAPPRPGGARLADLRVRLRRDEVVRHLEQSVPQRVARLLGIESVRGGDGRRPRRADDLLSPRPGCRT